MKPINELTPEEWLETMKPPETQWNVLNLGAGVQSSCLALMAAKGEVGPMPDFAVFADTQAEPTEVYDWLDWLEKQLPFPVIRGTHGSLEADSLAFSTASARSKNYKEGQKYMRRIIPVFGQMPNGDVVAALGRKCTADYKIKPIEKAIKRRCEIARGQKHASVTQWVGISWDEVQRMKESNKPWTQMRWPLIEKKMSRRDCLAWMEANGYPEPPRSACYFCPFHSDTEWRRLRDEDPEHFQKAIEFDRSIRKMGEGDSGLRMTVHLHRSCKPLDEIDFNSLEQNGQESLDFLSECEGMCGV